MPRHYLSLIDPEPTTLYKIPENILVFPLCIYTSWATILLQEHKKESIKIQFKTKSGMFIQKNIHSIGSRIFNRIIHSQKKEENYSKFQKKAKI